MTVQDFFPETDEYSGPLLIPTGESDDAFGFKIGKMADLLREPGQEASYRANQLRYFAQNDLIRPYRQIGGGRTAHNIYAVDQILIAAVLARVLEFGTSDTAPLRMSSLVLQSWNKGDIGDGPAPARSPAMWIIKHHLANIDGWTFQLATFRHRGNGNRELRARIQNGLTKEGTKFRIGDLKDWEQRSVFAIDLKPVLDRLFGDKEKRATLFGEKPVH